MKNTQYEIASSELLKANGRFECYNTTEGTVHLARVSKKGKKMAITSKNLFNLSTSSFNLGVQKGKIIKVA